jgi:hypothetical protein
MADIFSRSGTDFQGSFTSDSARVTFAGGGTSSGAILGAGLITQSIGVNYTQSITQLFEIGTNFTYFVAGRAQGQVSIARVLGPRPIQTAFYAKYGNVCNAATNNLNFEAATGCDVPGVATAGGNTYTFGVNNAVITTIGITIASAQDMMINEQLSMRYVSLTLGRS